MALKLPTKSFMETFKREFNRPFISSDGNLFGCKSWVLSTTFDPQGIRDHYSKMNFGEIKADQVAQAIDPNCQDLLALEATEIIIDNEQKALPVRVLKVVDQEIFVCIQEVIYQNLVVRDFVTLMWIKEDYGKLNPCPIILSTTQTAPTDSSSYNFAGCIMPMNVRITSFGIAYE